METYRIRRIVVATDFSEGSDAAMERAFALAKPLDATVDLVHVLDTAILTAPQSLGAMPLIDPQALMDQIDEALTARIEKARSLGIVCQSDSLDGYPAREIVRHAEKVGADLIVVGTHGRTGVAKVIMGSVAQRVVQHATCPVLVIPPARKATER
jgi:nucleotide-binding universal stress UspA family protein